MSSWSSDIDFNNSSDFSFDSELSRRGEGTVRPFSGLLVPEALRRAALGVGVDGRAAGAVRFEAGELPMVMPNMLKPDDFFPSDCCRSDSGGTSMRERAGSLWRTLRIAAPRDATSSGSSSLVS